LDITGGGYGESATAASPATSYAQYSGPIAVRSTASFKAVAFPKAGEYTYTFYMYNPAQGLGTQSAVTGYTAVTWTVTVTAPNTAGTSLSRKYLSSDIWTAQNNKKNGMPSTDSALAVSAGTGTPAIVGYAFVTTANSAGDTRVAVGSGFSTVDESLTVTITGAGLIAQGDGTATSSIISTLNSRGTSSTIASGETIVIYNNGTAGVGTITVTRSTNGAAITTFSVTFFGDAKSAGVALSDTVTSLAGTASIAGLGYVNLTAQLKDAGANLLSSGTFYVFSSDTKVAGTVPTSTGATSYQTGHRCGNISDSWNTTTKVLTCPILLRDTGTAVITLRDSWTVTASTWTSNEVTVDVRGNVVRAITVAFDKATYAPGEKAILTLTATEVAAKALATRSGDTSRLTRVVSTPTLSQTTVPTEAGTQGTNYTDTTFLSYQDTGVETRVVTMPTYGTDVSYAVTIPGFGVGVENVTVTATAKVVNPQDALIAAATAAAAKAGADAVAAAAAAQAAATAAADAATDAALEAIDAANAATDAANLAAEAADAATVAAEEARDAADAATAAVEALATEVATLMAALKAQITTLANTVAKIAKKVKA